MCRYMFVATYSYVLAFREATFRGVSSRVFEKLGCVAGETTLRDSGTAWPPHGVS